MPEIIIDGKNIEFTDGQTVLQVAKKAGIAIPHLCFLEKFAPNTSCMVCVVKNVKTGRLQPSCALPATDGAEFENDVAEVIDARRAALELLLGDHVGDCTAPCQSACPASLEIPKMLRLITENKNGEALLIARKSLPLAATLGKICPAPCQKVCRRKGEAVQIKTLHGWLAENNSNTPACSADTGKQVAIIGAGPAGLSCAFFLKQAGVKCTIYEAHGVAGGSLRTEIGADVLPPKVLDNEIEMIKSMGVEIVLGKKIEQLHDSRLSNANAIIIATGPAETLKKLLDEKPDAKTMSTSKENIFVAGSAVRSTKAAVQSVAMSMTAAHSVLQYFSGVKVTLPAVDLTVRMGKVSESELNIFMQHASKAQACDPSSENLDAEKAKDESARCLHCDCRKADNCGLRDYSIEYSASTTKLKGERAEFVQISDHPTVILEPEKCIKCGICLAITKDGQEKFGLTFLKRGFDTKVCVPFDKSLSEGLTSTAEECVKNCPTGALAFK